MDAKMDTNQQLIEKIRLYDEYKGLSDYQIKIQIGGSKLAVKSQLMDELERLSNNELKPFQQLPTEIQSEILKYNPSYRSVSKKL